MLAIVVLMAAEEPRADLHHGDHGGDADDDAERRQRRAHDIAAQGLGGRPKGMLMLMSNLLLRLAAVACGGRGDGRAAVPADDAIADAIVRWACFATPAS